MRHLSKTAILHRTLPTHRDGLAAPVFSDKAPADDGIVTDDACAISVFCSGRDIDEPPHLQDIIAQPNVAISALNARLTTIEN